MPHTPFMQLGVPLAVMQTLPQALQLFGSVFVSTSHPFEGFMSQSA